jgi:hypothetical protein
MQGRTTEYLKEKIKAINQQALKYSVPQPQNLREIGQKILSQDQNDRNWAEQELIKWALQIQAAAEAASKRSISPTRAQAEQVLQPMRSAIAKSPTPPPVVSVSSAAAAAATPSAMVPVVEESLGQKILRLAIQKAKEGKQVGDGECWSLADIVMFEVGASPPRSRGGFNFGNKIATITSQNKVEISCAQPGDILQYINASFRRRVNFPNGGYSESTQMMPQHTAIVARVEGTKITVIESNVEGIKTPRRGVVDFAGMEAGSVEVWRAVPK